MRMAWRFSRRVIAMRTERPVAEGIAERPQGGRSRCCMQRQGIASTEPESHSQSARMNEYSIVRARPEHLREIPNIELAAARLLCGEAPESVLSETTSDSVLEDAMRQGHLWVALAGSAPVGFAHVEIIDARTAHLEEIDVLPAHGRRGLGTRLVTELCEWAAAVEYDAVTLTTFRDVPWNRPFYERLGFRVVPDADLSAALRAIVDDETRRGLDPSRRVVMKWQCGPTLDVREEAAHEDLQFLRRAHQRVQLRNDRDIDRSSTTASSAQHRPGVFRGSIELLSVAVGRNVLARPGAFQPRFQTPLWSPRA